MKTRTTIAVAFVFLAGTAFAVADGAATKGAPVAMVKKTVAAIKAYGPEEAYAAINASDSMFVDREVYTVTQSFTGVVPAHAVNPKQVRKDPMGAQDLDGKYFVKDTIERASKEASFWYDFKFVNPVTKKVQPKDMYCESLNKTAVCAGIYKP